MVRKFQSLPAEQREHMRGGDGTVTLTPGLQAGDYAAKLRLFSRITLPAGASIGAHVHEQEEEFFYILAGTGEFNDNGTAVAVGPGDSTVTHSGECHSIRNTGDAPLELLAVIATL